MLVQLLLGSALIGATAFVAALSWWGLELVLVRSHHWLVRPSHGLKLIVVLSLACKSLAGMIDCKNCWLKTKQIMYMYAYAINQV